MAKKSKFIPLEGYHKVAAPAMSKQAKTFYKQLKKRRTIRDFSDRRVNEEVIDHCLLAAGTAPSGANLQPWHFVVIKDPDVKSKIRIEAEKEEAEFYNNKAPKEWLDALAPLGTDEHKPFLEIAPYLIAVFSKSYDILPNGKKVKNYYVKESVGIATGMLITALHFSGLATLTHTPSPMNFLNKICQRPKNEKPYMIIVVGYPDENATIPVHALEKKPLEEIVSYL